MVFAGILITTSYVTNAPPPGSGSGSCSVGPSSLSNIWVFNLEDADGLLDQSAAAGNAQRKAYLGPGAASDPQIMVVDDRIVVIGQTSIDSVFEFDLPADPPPSMMRVFWRQLF